MFLHPLAQVYGEQWVICHQNLHKQVCYSRFDCESKSGWFCPDWTGRSLFWGSVIGFLVADSSSAENIKDLLFSLQVKTHLQAQTVAAIAVGHQHNHQVRNSFSPPAHTRLLNCLINKLINRWKNSLMNHLMNYLINPLINCINSHFKNFN